jgi:hypothetical protein
MKDKADREEYKKYVELTKKWAEDEKQRKEKENAQPLSELSVGDVKKIIRDELLKESRVGDLPLLIVGQRKKFTRAVIGLVVLFLAAFLVYQGIWHEGQYSAEIHREKLFVQRREGLFFVKSEIRPVNKKWQLCSTSEGTSGCSILLTPIEARFGNNKRLVFVSGDKVFWVNHDRTNPVEVRLVDGSWAFKSDMDDPEWIDFESLYDDSDNAPQDPRY